MFDEFIDEFIPVPGLREYLKKEPINVSEVADIISGVVIYLCAFSLLFKGSIMKLMNRKKKAHAAQTGPDSGSGNDNKKEGNA